MFLKFLTQKISWPAVMALVLLTVWFQALPIWDLQYFFRWNLLIVPLILLLCLCFSVYGRWSRWLLILFWVIYIGRDFDELIYKANHTWLAIWLLVPAIFFKSWWTDTNYRRYIRLMLGWVLIVSSFQKIVGGAYLDGSYISYLTYFGERSEGMFGFMCSEAERGSVCSFHAVVGWVVLFWQMIVGVLLMMDVRRWWVWAMEILFLVGAGIFADEMNFQLLILLCLAMIFGWNLRRWMIGVIVLILIIDVFKVEYFLELLKL